MIVLHHLAESRSERIFWALEELGLPYTVVVHQRSRFGGATKTLGEATQSGKAPSVQLDGEWISESAYILHRLFAYARALTPGHGAHAVPVAIGAAEQRASSVMSSTAITQQSIHPQSEASPAGIGASTATLSISPSSSSSSSSAASPTPSSSSFAVPHTNIDVELVPSDSSIYFAHWAEGSLMLWMQAFLLHRLTSRQVIDGRMKIKGKEVGEGVKEGVKEWSKWAGGVIYRPGVQRQIDLMEHFIKDHKYFSGTDRPGMGDFMLAYPMSTVIDEDESKAGAYTIGQGLRRWMALVRTRPAYQRGQERIRAEEEAQRPPPTAKL